MARRSIRAEVESAAAEAAGRVRSPGVLLIPSAWVLHDAHTGDTTRACFLRIRIRREIRNVIFDAVHGEVGRHVEDRLLYGDANVSEHT